MNRKGQALIEFNLVMLLVVLPLMAGGVTWFWTSYDRARCAQFAFSKARRQLLRTRQPVIRTETCGRLQETISLVPLEQLDHDKGALDFTDLTNEVSGLWELLLRS